MNITGSCQESDNDDVSLTSTIDNDWDEDEPFHVEEVLKQVTVDTEEHYLIRWEEDRRLTIASWEPHENLDEGTLDEWKKKRQKKKAGLIDKFNVQDWVDARIEARRAKYARHEKRNRIRRERGIDQTSYDKTLSEEEEEVRYWLDFESEDSGDDDLSFLQNGHHVHHATNLQDSSTRSPSSYGAQRSSIEEKKKDSKRGAEHPTRKPSLQVGRSSSSDVRSSTQNKAQGQQPGKGAAIGSSLTALSPKISAADYSRRRPSVVAAKPKTLKPKPTATKGPNLVLRRPSNSNVFAGGTSHRTRPTLSERAVDPKIAPQMLGKARLTNMLEKNSRNKDSTVVPASLPRNLISVDPSSSTYLKPTSTETSLKGSKSLASGDSFRQQGAEDAITEASAGPKGSETLTVASCSRQKGAEDATAEASSNRNGSKTLAIDNSSRHRDAKDTTAATSASPQGGILKDASVGKKAENNQAGYAQPTETPLPNLKKRKSVRFHEGSPVSGSIVSEVEDSLFVPSDHPEGDSVDGTNRPQPPRTPEKRSWTLPRRGTPTSTPSKKRRLLSGNRPIQLSDLTRRCTISNYNTEPINLTFDSVRLEEAADWYQEFSEPSVLKFEHLCIAQLYQKDSSKPSDNEQIARGVVSVEGEGRLLVEKVAHRLRLGSYGLVSYGQAICVIIHPGKCEAWEDNESLINRTSSQALRYIIRAKGADFCLPALTAPLQPEGSEKPLERMFPINFFGVNYMTLMAPSQQQATLDRHVFFLLFPPSAFETEKLLRRWLRYYNPHCILLTSSAPGHWSSFRQAPSGALILHEDVTWMVRRFPGWAEVLNTPPAALNLWQFGRKVRAKVAHLNRSDDIGIANKDLPAFQPIFPVGDLLLVTPSFVDAHPAQFSSLVRWLYTKHISSDWSGHQTKLALAGNFNMWLLDLIKEKHRKNEVFEEQLKLLSDDRRQESGLDKSDHIQALVTSCSELRQLMDSEFSGEPVVHLAPHEIDANDEQSLVNWLGKWSLENVEIARNFFVVGSATVFMLPGLYPWRPNEIKVPRYRPMQLVHTDEQSHLGQRRSLKDTIESTKSSLKQIRHNLGYSPVILNWKIVSYWDSELPSHLRGIRKDSHLSYRAWFDHLLPFDTERRPVRNTYIGFFYTPQSSWDAKRYPEGDSGPLHPWFAIFRPVNPHLPKAWQTTELFIWDAAVSQYYEEKEVVCETDLIESHKHLVRVVSEGSKTTHNKPLSQVWIGGFGDDNGDPIEVTKNHLEWVLQNLKQALPAPVNLIKDRGWQSVDPPHQQPAATNERASSPQQTSLPEPDGGEGDKIVVPAPVDLGPSDKTSPGFSNLLYKEAQKATTSGKKKMSFSFEPTMDWYKQQVNDGGGFEHLRVEPWDAIFRDLNIPPSIPKEVGDEDHKEDDL